MTRTIQKIFAEGAAVWQPTREYSPTPGSSAGAAAFEAAEKFTRLRTIAFGSLWLLVFAMPWEDAITIPGFGTVVRLIGMVALGLGALAIFERGKVRKPALGH